MEIDRKSRAVPNIIFPAVDPNRFVGRYCLYLIHVYDDYYKFGISNKIVRRMKDLLREFRTLGHDPLIMYIWTYDDHLVSKNIETRIKDYAGFCGLLRTVYKKTEFIQTNDIKHIVDKILEYTKFPAEDLSHANTSKTFLAKIAKMTAYSSDSADSTDSSDYSDGTDDSDSTDSDDSSDSTEMVASMQNMNINYMSKREKIITWVQSHPVKIGESPYDYHVRYIADTKCNARLLVFISVAEDILHVRVCRTGGKICWQ